MPFSPCASDAFDRPGSFTFYFSALPDILSLARYAFLCGSGCESLLRAGSLRGSDSVLAALALGAHLCQRSGGNRRRAGNRVREHAPNCGLGTPRSLVGRVPREFAHGSSRLSQPPRVGALATAPASDRVSCMDLLDVLPSSKNSETSCSCEGSSLALKRATSITSFFPAF